ncbi:MAG: heavy metal-responsive transcriptional regulator [Gemmatimonadetes bacterium]|nr:heavy metal-responsive transcriptional regulator [Gemmatimonadota bacterium]
MTIGGLARAAGVSADTLRYYERLGLLPRAQRSSAGYRLFDPSAADRIAFIRKAQALGLTLEEVREVLRIAADGTAPCQHVRAALSSRLSEVDTRIEELESLRRTLTRALARSRALPVAGRCVCGIIEAEPVSAPVPRPAARPRRARTVGRHTRR